MIRQGGLFCSREQMLHLAIVFIVYLLFCIGFVTLYSALSGDTIDKSKLLPSLFGLLGKQVFFGLTAVTIGFCLYRIDINRWLNLSIPLLYLLIAALAATLMPFIGVEVNGSRRWLNLFGISVQPSELLKVLMPCYLIAKERHMAEKKLKDWLKVIAPPAIAISLILAEPNNGTAAFLLLELFLVLWLIGMPLKFLLPPTAALALLLLLSLVFSPYVRGRLEVYWDPEKDLLGKGHQPHQAKIAVGSGAVLGRGIGKSMQKFSYLPEAQNDYIAAIYAEEFGFAGMTVLIGLWMGLALLFISACLDCSHLFCFRLCVSMSLILLLQAVMNLSVVCGILPSTGLNLPFFSMGGSSLVACCSAIGLLLNGSSSRNQS